MKSTVFGLKELFLESYQFCQICGNDANRREWGDVTRIILTSFVHPRSIYPKMIPKTGVMQNL